MFDIFAEKSLKKLFENFILYQAIKNKISLAELLDSSRGRWNEKKLINLMNIVIQLRKVLYLSCAS